MKQIILRLWLKWHFRKQSAMKVTEIYQDNAIQAIHWHDRLIIICHHSIWEIADNNGSTEARLLCR